MFFLSIQSHGRGLKSLMIHLLLLSCWFSESKGFFQPLVDVYEGAIDLVGNVVCKGVTCCEFRLNDYPPEYTLYNLMKSKLYGQHIASSLVYEAVLNHRSQKPRKALGIGLHGWTGTGKNYVSQMIAESMYKEGMKSPLVHVFAGRAAFPVDAEVNQYKKDLLGWIRGNVSQCGHSLFIFDESDKMPESLLEVIKPLLDYHHVIGGVDFRNAVFLFLSNAGGSLVGERFLELHEEGKMREDFVFEDFHNHIALYLFNQRGGFYRSSIIQGDGIDFHIPFLPLEERHVRLCAIDEYKRRGYPNPPEEMIKHVLSNLQYGPKSMPIFSETGCKHVHALVTSAIARRKLEL